jgi:GntR family transcriptional regulator
LPARDPANRRLVYEQIANDLRTAISSGQIGPSEKLPSENELADTYGVQRATIRQGLRVLVDEGLIVARPKRGYFVRQVKTMRWNMSTRDSIATTDGDPWKHAAAEAGYVGRHAITVRTAGADQRVMNYRLGDLLHLNGGLAVCRSRLHYLDDDPTEIGDSYFPLELVKDTALMNPADIPAGTFKPLAELGWQRVRYDDEWLARMPTRYEAAERLELPPATPVIEMIRRWFFERPDATVPDERCLLVRHSVYAGGGNRFRYSGSA